MNEKTVLTTIFYILIGATIFGVPYFFEDKGKYVAYGVMFVILAVLGVRLVILRKRDNNHKKTNSF